MSGNGKQVQGPPNNSQRYCLQSTRSVPQRADGYPVPSGGVGGGFLPTNTIGSHHLRISQTPTPPQEPKPQMYNQQSSVRAQQFSQPAQYRGAQQQPQSGVNVGHHQPRQPHHRQPSAGPGASAPTAPYSYSASQPVLYNYYVPHLHPTFNPQQQPPRNQFYQQQSQTMSMMPHTGYYCPQPQQQQYNMYPGGAPTRGGPSPGQMTPAQSVPQPVQPHTYGATRFPPQMPHTNSSDTRKIRPRALPIIDPASGKEIVTDDNSGVSDNASIPQPDENCLAVVEEFNRRVSEIIANEKDSSFVESISKDDVISNSAQDVCYDQGVCDSVSENHSNDNKTEVECYNQDKMLKHSTLSEVNETPVVSAISNSPEIVPKHINKPKPIEVITTDSKKSQSAKPSSQGKHPPAEGHTPTTNNEDPLPLTHTMVETKELEAQHILTSALQSKSPDQDNILDLASSNEDKQLPQEAATVETKLTNNLFINCSNPEEESSTVGEDNGEAPVQCEYVAEQAQPLECVNDKHVVAECTSSTEVAPLNEDPSMSHSQESGDKVESSQVDQQQDNVTSSAINDSYSASQVTCDSFKKTDDGVDGLKSSTDVEEMVDNNDCAQVMDAKVSESNIEMQPAAAAADSDRNDVIPVEAGEKEEDKAKGPVLRYTYKEDQWSPLNTTGKKRYDTEFLMALKDDPNSKKRPENLNQFEILAENTNRQSRNNDVRSVPMQGNDLLPTFAKSNVPNRKSQHGKPTKDAKGLPPPGQGPPSRSMIHVNLSLRSDVKLNESENAWKPARMRQENLSEEELQTRELCKTFTGTLNKLTPQNFDTLIAQVRKLNINTESRLSKIIDLLFEKAIDEPNFSLTYALMCKELSELTSLENTNVNFRVLILNRCKNEFEKNDDTAKRMQKEIDEVTDPEKKKEMLLNLEEVESKIRRRSVGNVRFIGEIFKQDLIRPHVVVGCIEHLLKEVEEETLECLCKLLTTIGKDLERKHNEDLQPYFVTMKNIVEKKRKEISSRVWFMLQDIIDLRCNNWVPRQQTVNPKTMDQIKLEVELEQNKSIFHSYTSSSLARKDDRPNTLNKKGGSKSEEGWSQASNRNSRNKTASSYNIDSGKLSKMIPDKPVTMTSLQPHGISLNTWGKGSTVSKKTETTQLSSQKLNRNSSSSGRKPAETSNTYHILESDSDNLSEGSVRNVPYKSKRGPMERSTSKSNDSEEQSGDNASESDDKIKTILEYAHSDTAYGMLGRIQDTISAPTDYPILCKELILWGMEYKERKNMQTIGEVTGTLVDDELISSQEFLKILKQTMDMSTDTFRSKNVWTMLAGFIWAHMKKSSLTLEQIHNAFSNALKLGYGYNFLTAIIIDSLRASPQDMISLWQESSLTLGDWMDEDNVSNFLDEFNLSWINKKKQMNKSDCEEACTEMLKLMRDGKSRDEVKRWITKNIGDETREGWFIRALTEAIHTHGLCCEDAFKKPILDLSRLDRFYPLLSQYVVCDDKLELEVLFAIQRLMNKLEHPQGIAIKLFDYLWDCGDIVSLEAINTWEKNSDPKEQEGKGVMLKTLTSFLTSIKSEDPSSDEASAICEEGY